MSIELGCWVSAEIKGRKAWKEGGKKGLWAPSPNHQFPFLQKANSTPKYVLFCYAPIKTLYQKSFSLPLWPQAYAKKVEMLCGCYAYIALRDIPRIPTE
jgi:hypothetical protein